MNQHASQNSVPPSVGMDVSGIETLLNRNLPEVFGEGDPARRSSAIQELSPAYTGVDFIIARDGKIAALYVYLDSPPT
jgi:hypothetical protein